MKQREYQTLILAGLLHDVGKLLIKAPKEREQARTLSQQATGRARAAHWILGEDYLRRKGIGDELSRLGIDLDLLCFAVRWHHFYYERDAAAQVLKGLGDKKEVYRRVSNCTVRADGMSAGERSLERIPRSEWQEATARPLGTIFAGLELGRPREGAAGSYRPVPLHPRAAFPRQVRAEVAEDDYRELVEAFSTDLRHALGAAQNWHELEAAAYSLLERYTWAVPSDVLREPPEVSLFDHARTSCAIAAALALRGQPEFASARPWSPSFLLVGGDVSGVQDYIYSVANVGPGGVAKRLRARSFFITALTEVVAHRLRQELVPGYELPIAAQLMAGGGQFVLLAPNLDAVRDNLKRIRREVNRWLWDEFQGDLALVIEAEGLTQAQLRIKGGNAAQALDRLRGRIDAGKQRRLGDLLQDGGGWVEEAFKWEVKAYPDGACPSCGRLPARAGEEQPIDARLCPRCHRDRLLSERLVDASYVAYFRGPALRLAAGQQGDWLRRRCLSLFEGDAARHVVVLKNREDLARIEGVPYQLDGFGYGRPAGEGTALVRHFAGYVPHFRTMGDLAAFCTAERKCVHVRYTEDDTCGILVRPDGSRVGGGDFPIVQTFGCLSAAAAEWPDGSLGSQLLGVLRADVDHLGKLFTLGLGQTASLSRLATLSRMTDLFFSGWVHHTLERPPEGKGYDRIYTVYAGGDDLCLVGPWDEIVDFGHHLAAEFARYTAHNPNVTLSAAIAVTKPKYPIASSARLAGRWLEARAKDRGRNRLHLFGVTVRWRDLPPWQDLDEDLREQWAEVEAHARLLWDDVWPWAELLDEELRCWRAAGGGYPVSGAFAHRLLDYAERARRWDEDGEITAEDMLYLAHLAYDLGRNVVKSDAVSGKTKQELSRLTQLENREVMAGMRLPITYALYRNRERSGE
ncbi:MAG: HD domain-containing protein [Anaerolineae bacterium]|nr:HD domain-containing protein [Anaerolineae bacterium]